MQLISKLIVSCFYCCSLCLFYLLFHFFLLFYFFFSYFFLFLFQLFEKNLEKKCVLLKDVIDSKTFTFVKECVYNEYTSLAKRGIFIHTSDPNLCNNELKRSESLGERLENGNQQNENELPVGRFGRWDSCRRRHYRRSALQDGHPIRMPDSKSGFVIGLA